MTNNGPVKRIELAPATDYGGLFSENDKIRDQLKKVADAGFAGIHWCFEWYGDYMYSSQEMDQIKDWLDEYGLSCKGVHGSHGSVGSGGTRLSDKYRRDFLSIDDKNRRAGLELIKNRIHLAKALGTRELVMHAYLPYEDFSVPGKKDLFYNIITRSLSEIEDEARRCDVRLCIENLYEAAGPLQIEEFSYLLERFSAEYLGLCIDTGHANMVWGPSFTEKLIKPFSDRIYIMHLHDNDGVHDQHIIPGQGNIDWKAVMSVLKETACSLPLVLEVDERSSLGQDVKLGEPETDRLFLGRLKDAGEKLLDYFEEA